MFSIQSVMASGGPGGPDLWRHPVHSLEASGLVQVLLKGSSHPGLLSSVLASWSGSRLDATAPQLTVIILYPLTPVCCLLSTQYRVTQPTDRLCVSLLAG